MPPFLLTLLSQGLGLLGNAVIAKGKEVVEKKLGVDLEAAVKTEEGLYKLKQLELDHEVELLNMAVQQDKMYIEDVQDARNREIKISETENASWLTKNITSFLALIVVIGGGAIICFSPDADVRLGMTSIVTLVLGYYFGMSRSVAGNVPGMNKLFEGAHK